MRDFEEFLGLEGMRAVQIDLLFEKITKELQEKGQRAMVSDDLKPFIRLKKDLDEKWSKTKITSKELKRRKNDEYKRLDEIILYANSAVSETSEKAKTYINKVLGFGPQFFSLDSEELFGKKDIFMMRGEGGFPIVITVGDPTIKNNEYDSGWTKTKINSKQVEDILKKLIISHEYGHLYNWGKRYIETGEFKLIGFGKNTIEELSKEEGEANEFAFKNMYRKDRRELLKSSDLTKEKLDNAKEDDVYLNGLKKYSPTVRKLLDSLNKEEMAKRDKHIEELKKARKTYFKY